MPEVEGDKIVVSHLNIRPSISVLLLQLVTLEIMVAGLILVGNVFLQGNQSIWEFFLTSSLGLVLLTATFSLQVLLTVYAVLQWVNDYYELFPDALIHRKGMIFRKIEKFPLENVKFALIEQGFLGQLLNFGTITLLDARRQKFLDLYLVHNPNKYLEVFDKFGDINITEDVLREEVFNRPERVT